MLSDFGFSTAEGQPQTGKTLESVKNITELLYQAPELALKPPKASERSDIYSVCTILFYAVSGQHPFTSLQNKLSGKTQDIKTFESRLPNALVEVITRGMLDDLDYRFTDAFEFSSALKETCN